MKIQSTVFPKELQTSVPSLSLRDNPVRLGSTHVHGRSWGQPQVLQGRERKHRLEPIGPSAYTELAKKADTKHPLLCHKQMLCNRFWAQGLSLSAHAHVQLRALTLTSVTPAGLPTEASSHPYSAQRLSIG